MIALSLDLYSYHRSNFFFFFPIKIVDWRPFAVDQFKITFLLSRGLPLLKNHTWRLVSNKKRLLKTAISGGEKHKQETQIVPSCPPKASRSFVLLRKINLNLGSGSLDWLS